MSALKDDILCSVYHRINEKRRDHFLPIKHITLGIDIYNNIRNITGAFFLINSLFSVSPHRKKSKYNYADMRLFGYPVTIAYRRKNLIQINIKRSTTYRFAKKANLYKTIDYMNAFEAYGDGGKSMFSDMIYNIYQNNNEEDCQKTTWNTLKKREMKDRKDSLELAKKSLIF